MRVQSNSASSQCKNKHSSGLQQSLTDQFSLRIIRTYGAAGNGKGAIDTMSSFGVKSIVKKDLVTHDVLCNNSCDMAEYLASQNPLYYYHTIPVESVVLAQQKDGSPIELQGCMKQHLIIFKPNEKYFCKEYLHPVCILTLEIAQVKMFMLRLKIRIRKKNFFMRRLIKWNQFSILSQCHHSFLCILESQSSHSFLSKFLEKVLPKRTFLIPADTL